MNVTSQILISCPLDLPLSSFNCSYPYPNCTSPNGFDFEITSQITKYIATCATDWRLFEVGTELITQAACEQIAGSDDFNYYSGEDIWTRLTTWKFPLLQLVAIFPRAPLSIASQMLTIVSLLGNPLSTLRHLMLKLASCEERSRYWQAQFRGPLRVRLDDTKDSSESQKLQWWKAFSLITDTYDEWGKDKGDHIVNFLNEQLMSGYVDNKRFMKLCEEIAATLAADRATKSLPVIVAQGFFIGAIAIAIAKTPEAAKGPKPDTFINIEVHSIAFSTLYFWIIPTVIIGSIIGASQTEHSIPRILQQFQTNLDHAFPEWPMKLPNDFLLNMRGELDPATNLREESGGIYTYTSPSLYRRLRRHHKHEIKQCAPRTTGRIGGFLSKMHTWVSWPGSPILTHSIILGCLAGGLILSALVPPEGFGPRDIAELSMVLCWVVNSLLDYLPWSQNHHKYKFWFSLTKDLVSTCLTMGAIVATQIGVLNRCSAFTLWGRTGLQLPETLKNASKLNHGIHSTYPAIAFLCVGFSLLVFPAIIFYQYSSAVRVYVQRDDGRSNLDWLPRFWQRNSDSATKRVRYRRREEGIRHKATCIATDEEKHPKFAQHIEEV